MSSDLQIGLSGILAAQRACWSRPTIFQTQIQKAIQDSQPSWQQNYP